MEKNLKAGVGKGSSFWRKLFVNDKNDKRIIVEKRLGYGYTINFGAKGGKFLFFLIVILPLIFIFFLLILHYMQRI